MCCMIVKYNYTPQWVIYQLEQFEEKPSYTFGIGLFVNLIYKIIPLRRYSSEYGNGSTSNTFEPNTQPIVSWHPELAHPIPQMGACFVYIYDLLF